MCGAMSLRCAIASAPLLVWPMVAVYVCVYVCVCLGSPFRYV